MNEVLQHIIASISPASVAQATGATQRLMRANMGREHGGLSEVAARLCAARHAPAPSLENRVVAVIASDHGVASPGIDLGENNPTIVGMRLMAEGGAAINSAVRSAKAQLVLVDAGVRGGEEHDLGRGVLRFRTGNGTDDFSVGSAMSKEQAAAAVQTGIALAFSLADAGLDLLALGQLAAGCQPTSAAIVAALLAVPSSELPALSPADADVVSAGLAHHQFLESGTELEALTLLAGVGGFDIGVMCGMILAAASINVPVVLDGHGSSAAALLAHRLNPNVRGYLFASHAGGIPSHRRVLQELKLEPLFAVGLAQGEGTGAALAMPMLEAALRVLQESSEH